MSSSATQLKKTLIFAHRWMGVCFCLLFLSWFASGMVLMYWDYPMVSSADRLARAPALDPGAIHFSPRQAYASLQTDVRPDGVELETLDGRPAYRFRFAGDEARVYADNGETQSDFPPDLTLRIASSWTHQPPFAAAVEEIAQPDQWTVSGEFAALRPLRKYSWPDGEQVYVSTVTGDVVQYTTHASRWGAYLGAIPHWLYFTALRKRPSRWAAAVIWGSGLAALGALLGIVLGMWMYSPSQRYRPAEKASSIPYTGQKRWHMALGLLFGPLVCTWAFSGMLSMDPFPRLQGENFDETGSRLEQSLRGSLAPLSAFAGKSPREALAQTPAHFNAARLELASFHGQPVYLAASATQTFIVPIGGNPSADFDARSIVEILREAARPAAIDEVRLVTQYEAYYLDRHNRLPLPAIFIRLNDAARSTYYVDPKSAEIVASYNSRARWNRWLYHGFHSLDLPWLYRHRPLWDIVILTLLGGGTALCFTSLVLAWRVLLRQLIR